MKQSKYFYIWIGLSALLIAGSAAAFSVYGLAKLFSGAFLSVVVMASSLELGKLVTASFLYRYWNMINWFQKVYMTLATIVLIFITSAGIFGYLSNAYQGATLEFEKQSTELLMIDDRLEQLQDDKLFLKQELDQQVESLPENYITAKRKLREDYNPQIRNVNEEILNIKTRKADLEIQLVSTGVDVGPAIYLARTFGTDIDTVVKFFIFILIFVFDPMAISLIIAYNRVLEDENIKEKKPINWIEGMSTELKKKKLNVKKSVKIIEKNITPKVKPIPDPGVIGELEEKVLNEDIGKGGRTGR